MSTFCLMVLTYSRSFMFIVQLSLEACLCSR